MSIPSAEAFKEAINLSSSYLTMRNELFRNIHDWMLNKWLDCTEELKAQLLQEYETTRKEILNNNISKYKMPLMWLIEQPAFKLAYGDLIDYANSDRLHEITEAIYKGDFENDLLNLFFSYGGNTKLHDYGLTAILSGLCEFIHLYLTDAYIEKATEAKKELLELKKILHKLHDKVDRINALQWKPDRIELISLPSVDFNRENDKRRSITELESIIKREFGTTRNDTSIKERMFISDLIKLHIRLFNNPEKNRITKIMSLPFFNNAVEQRTIERLISKCLDN